MWFRTSLWTCSYICRTCGLGQVYGAVAMFVGHVRGLGHIRGLGQVYGHVCSYVFVGHVV